MSAAVTRDLIAVLATIDRPGTFCTSGGAAPVLPGLEVPPLGAVGLPLAPAQAAALKKLCEQAPYGKGTETLVDPAVRRVWRLPPDRFQLLNPEWPAFLRQTVAAVQEALGLEKQPLESHLYELLLYEPGSFFLPHRDGEKLDRMVATLVILLPSTYTGGELVVRHEGEEQVVDCSGPEHRYRICYAAFYADCEHEIRPLRSGHRLCLVYNLTLARAQGALAAPRLADRVGRAAQVLQAWAADPDGQRLMALPLDHQYTRGGLAWDALKGTDRVKARVQRDAARRAGCRCHLALLTFHESGAAEYGGPPRRGRGWGRRHWEEEEDEDDDAGDYEMGEIFESELTLGALTDEDGRPAPLTSLDLDEDEVVPPEALTRVQPEEEFEGYTGNAGMTLDRWYRHAAIVLWPTARHLDIVLDGGLDAALGLLAELTERWRQAAPAEAAGRRDECRALVTTILERWPTRADYPSYARPAAIAGLEALGDALAQLDEPALWHTFLTAVVTADATAEPGPQLVQALEKHGWAAFQADLAAVFAATTAGALERNVRLLERLCAAKLTRRGGGAAVLPDLAEAAVAALVRFDTTPPADPWSVPRVDRAAVLAGLARALVAARQEELLAQVIAHAFEIPASYPLVEAHVAAWEQLEPWLAKHVKQPSPALRNWLAACLAQLEHRTAAEPQAPADWRRDAPVPCNCADCAELKQFLGDPAAPAHRFPVAQQRRNHLASAVRQHQLDLDLRTEERGRPYTLICTKNNASFRARLALYHEDLERLARLRRIGERLPARGRPRA